MTFQKYVKVSGHNGVVDIVINKIVIHTHRFEKNSTHENTYGVCTYLEVYS